MKVFSLSNKRASLEASIKPDELSRKSAKKLLDGDSSEQYRKISSITSSATTNDMKTWQK